MKKSLVILLLLIMILGVLTACDGSSEKGQVTQENVSKEEVVNKEASKIEAEAKGNLKKDEVVIAIIQGSEPESGFDPFKVV